MKKIISILSVLLFTGSLLTAQVLSKQGVSNTLSVSMGEPYDSTDNANRDKFYFYGFIDTLQARVDIQKFTLEGMLSWGALYGNSGFSFENTDKTPYFYTNSWRDKKLSDYYDDATSDPFYVNFIWHPAKYVDVGVGTRVNWVIGPAPSYGGFLWEPSTHIFQGGLKYANGTPGDAAVVGLVKYANCYARTAIAGRFKNEMFEAGFAIPDGTTTNSFQANFAFGITPLNWLTAGAAFEASFGGESNFYTGVEMSFKKDFIVDAYLAIDNIAGTKGNIIWGTGASLKAYFSKIGLYLKPEVGFTFYENPNYSLATYAGMRGELGFKNFVFGLWSSFAWGSKDKRWAETKDWTGGFVFDIRPDVTYQFNKNNSFSAMFDIQYCKSYDNFKHNTWATSAYWTYKY